MASTLPQIRLSQLATSAFCAVLSICIIGTASHTLSVFKSQQPQNPWWLPLWPDHFDTHGTSGLIGSGVVVFIFNVAFLVVMMLPKLEMASRPTLRALLTMGITFPTAIITLATMVYAHVLNAQAPQGDTIQTWTCRLQSDVTMQSTPQSSFSNNASFSSLCGESKFALYGTLVVFILEVLSFGVAIGGWVAEKLAERKQKKAYRDGVDSLEMGSREGKEGFVNVQAVPPYQ